MIIVIVYMSRIGECDDDVRSYPYRHVISRVFISNSISYTNTNTITNKEKCMLSYIGF